MYMPDKIHVYPPRPWACPVCAAKHRPEEPHDYMSLYYMNHFYRKHKRFPTPEDVKGERPD